MSDPSFIQNQLLSLLSEADAEPLVARSEIVELVKGVDLARAGDAIEYCWFPLSGLVSVIASDEDDRQAEIGVIGREGMVNSTVVMGNSQSAMRILVQIGGSAVRVEARAVLKAASRIPGCFRILAAFHEALAIQSTCSALAYAHYDIFKRLARWVLMCADRVGDDHIDLTHDALSIMLGVRRSGVTIALQELERRGAICTRRGGLSVSSRPTLLGIAGSGYGPAEAQYRRLLSV